MLKDKLRRAREAASLSQRQLAVLAGIPRNQGARAERGENITLDTLPKIVVHLPIHELPLIENVNLTVDAVPRPEKLFAATVETVQQLAVAMGTAIQAAMLGHARKATSSLPNEDGQESADIDPAVLLRQLAQSVKALETFSISETS
jgi:transcriptional regulator with XRE-family HTH domain